MTPSYLSVNSQSHVAEAGNPSLYGINDGKTAIQNIKDYAPLPPAGFDVNY